MAHLLNCENVTVVRGERSILDEVSLGLDDGARVGVVGRNGDGKSTLLSVLSGQLEPDSGRVSHARGLRVATLRQQDDAGGHSVAHEVLGRRDGERLDSRHLDSRHLESQHLDPEHPWEADQHARSVVAGLLGDIEAGGAGGWDAALTTLSGGQRRRVALARTLLTDHDLLILDEPTNHLDLEGVSWLARYLRTERPPDQGALLLVTHDRWFLDEVCERTWEVGGGAIQHYDGGYAAYVLARAERARIADSAARKRNNALRKELAWLRRGPPARTSKPKFRIDAATALIGDEPPPRDTVDLLRTAASRLGKEVLSCENVSHGMGSGESRQELFKGVTWHLGPGDRIAILGANGSGKTTLLNLLAGKLTADSGRVKRGKTVRLEVLTQSLAELDEVNHLRVAEVIAREQHSVRIDGKEVSASVLVERLGFSGARAWTPVSALSGGERRRLQLARLLMREPNTLFLDEPTNDLDTDTLASMEDVLDSFAGTLVVVSHDRYLLERLTDRQVGLLGDGSVRDLPGGVEEYLHRKQLPGSPTRGAPVLAVADRPTGATTAADQAQPPPASAARQRTARKDAARLERQLDQLHAREQALHVEMTEHASDHVRMTDLTAALNEVLAATEETEQAWLEVTDIL